MPFIRCLSVLPTIFTVFKRVVQYFYDFIKIPPGISLLWWGEKCIPQNNKSKKALFINYDEICISKKPKINIITPNTKIIWVGYFQSLIIVKLKSHNANWSDKYPVSSIQKIFTSCSYMIHIVTGFHRIDMTT